MDKKKTQKSEIKSGHGNQINSADWSATYNSKYDKYVARVSYCSGCGFWMSLYEISKETYDKLGTFENDDYKTEQLIRREGNLLYRFEDERNWPEPTEIAYDSNYKVLCKQLLK